MKNFEMLNLHPLLAESLEAMEYTTPTPIQAKAIPFALEGRDVMGSAQTGTGKTGAFSIPAVQHLLDNERSRVLVLTPTRELAKQVMDVMKQLLGHKSGIRTAFLIGGDSMFKQCRQLEQMPRLIVGTPGRINDHLKRQTLDLELADFLVLDETDRMLDMGFSEDVNRIISAMAAVRQTLMFSATLPQNILDLSANYMIDPARVSAGTVGNPAKNIKHGIIHVNEADKYEVLSAELHARKGSVIIFTKTKRGADRLAKRLDQDGHKAEPIHGGLQQRKRDRVIREFRGQRFRILVATDVAARGLDIPHIEHVINYDLPQVAEDYIHRIGRTARAGAEGEALALLSPKDGRVWHVIERLMYPEKQAERAAEKDQPLKKKKRNQNKNKNRKLDKRDDFSEQADQRKRKKPKRKPATSNSQDAPTKRSGKKQGEGKASQKKREKFQGKKAGKSMSGDQALRRKPRKNKKKKAA